MGDTNDTLNIALRWNFILTHWRLILLMLVACLIARFFGVTCTENPGGEPGGGPSHFVSVNPNATDGFTLWKTMSDITAEAQRAAYRLRRYPALDHGPFHAYIATTALQWRQWDSTVCILEFKDLELNDWWLGERCWRIRAGRMHGDCLQLQEDLRHYHYSKHDHMVPPSSLITDLTWEPTDSTAPRVLIDKQAVEEQL